MPLYLYACDRCGVENDLGLFPLDHVELCARCGEAMTRVPQKVNTPEWGGPKFVGGLDREFASRSDRDQFLRACNFSEAGDKVGGARNEDHLNLGKAFSIPGRARMPEPGKVTPS